MVWYRLVDGAFHKPKIVNPIKDFLCAYILIFLRMTKHRQE